MNRTELTFREVINSIKEGEVWEFEAWYIKYENETIRIINKYGFDRGDTGVFLKDYVKWKLRREKHSFTTALEAFKQGREIESMDGVKYKFHKDTMEVFIKEPKYQRETIYLLEDTLFRYDEVLGEWYIND
ncbi:hypothetical protein [Clostridium perfringens]|uniref:hypothetical protein n=1 Tax=Clostridium perfringens TaxID=1502 RepID=UPI0032D9B557